MISPADLAALGAPPPPNAHLLAAIAPSIYQERVAREIPLSALMRRSFLLTAARPVTFAGLGEAASDDDRVRVTALVRELEALTPAPPSPRVAAARAALQSLEAWTGASWTPEFAGGYADYGALRTRIMDLADRALVNEGRAAPPPPTPRMTIALDDPEVAESARERAAEVAAAARAGAKWLGEKKDQVEKAFEVPTWLKVTLGAGAIAAAAYAAYPYVKPLLRGRSR